MKFLMIMQLDEIWDLSTVQNHTIIQHQKPCLCSISWTLPAELQQHLVGRPAQQQTTKPRKVEKYTYNTLQKNRKVYIQHIFIYCSKYLHFSPHNYEEIMLYNSKMMEIDPINKLKKLSKSPCTFPASVHLFYYPAFCSQHYHYNL